MTSVDDELIDAIADGLAKRAALVRSVPESRLRKEAAAEPGFLSNAFNYVAEHPTLPGAALGAGLGGLAGYMRSDEKDKRRNAWTGALAGGALGGGLGAAAEFVPWDEKGRSIARALADARGSQDVEGMFEITPKVLPGVGGAAAGMGASSLLERSDYGVTNPRTVWRDPTRAGTENVLKSGLQVAGRIGTQGEGGLDPAVVKALQDPDQLQDVLTGLRANESVTMQLPAATKLDDLNKTLKGLDSSLNKLRSGASDDIVEQVRRSLSRRVKNVKINDSVLFQAIQNEMVKVTEMMDEVRTAGANVPVEITRTHMDDLMEAGFRAQMSEVPEESKNWAHKLTSPAVEGVRKATASDTPYLTRNWLFDKQRGWSLPGRGMGRRALSAGAPIAAGLMGYDLIKGLQNAVTGRSGSSSAAARARQLLGG